MLSKQFILKFEQKNGRSIPLRRQFNRQQLLHGGKKRKAEESMGGIQDLETQVNSMIIEPEIDAIMRRRGESENDSAHNSQIHRLLNEMRNLRRYTYEVPNMFGENEDGGAPLSISEMLEQFGEMEEQGGSNPLTYKALKNLISMEVGSTYDEEDELASVFPGLNRTR